jgi:hypothetical protein
VVIICLNENTTIYGFVGQQSKCACCKYRVLFGTLGNNSFILHKIFKTRSNLIHPLTSKKKKRSCSKFPSALQIILKYFRNIDG